LNRLAADRFEAESAGLEPGRLNPLVVEVMKEAGMDISGNKTKSVLDLFSQGRQYDDVISLCDEFEGGACPVFPGVFNRLHWSFEDPSGFSGTHEEKLQKTRKLRDAIKAKIEQWVDEKRQEKGDR